MKKIVTKFGGSSLADAGQFRKVKDILLLDEARQYVIPSAPGRRFKDDDKVTDLLYRCHKQKSAGEDYQDTFDLIAARYMDIAEELGLHVDLGAALDEVNEKIDAGGERGLLRLPRRVPERPAAGGLHGLAVHGRGGSGQVHGGWRV